MTSEFHDATKGRSNAIHQNSAAPHAAMPPGHVGEFVIPGTGRLVWWTGRVAIGLLHQPQRYFEPVSKSSLWLQELMLGSSRKAHVAQA